MKWLGTDPARRTAKLALLVISVVEIAAIAMVSMSSCSKNDDKVTNPGPPPPPAGTPADVLALVRRSLPDRFLYPVFAVTALDSGLSIAVSADVSGAQAAAAGFRGTFGLIDAGDVQVSASTSTNTYALGREGLTVSGIPQYVYSTRFAASPLITLPFDGASHHRFSASGAGFPAFHDSIRSVPPLQLTWPTGGAFISRNEDALVSWNIDGDPTLGVMATVFAPGDTTLHYGTVYALDSDGSLMIPTAQLQAVPPPSGSGQAVIAVARFRSASRLIGGHPLFLLSESASSRTVNMVDSIPGLSMRPQLAARRRR